jgi:transcriptional regulator with XRE-family HTH domain
MGRSHRQRPERLAAKLQAIRTQLDLTQEQMIKRLDCPAIPLYPASISQYESGKREPPLLVLLQYAKVAGVPMDVLVDDERDLPEPLPSLSGYEWIMKRVRLGKQQHR